MDVYRLLRSCRLHEIANDEVIGLVVLANSEGEARSLAARMCGTEGESVWHSTRRSSCEKIDLGKFTQPVMLLRSICEGDDDD